MLYNVDVDIVIQHLS